jgi:hypothetical protein
MASNQKPLRIVVIKPSKYDHEGFVERYHKGFMPNATIPFIASMASEIMENSFPEVQYDLVVLDEYVETSLNNFYIGDNIRIFGYIPGGSNTVTGLVLRNASR